MSKRRKEKLKKDYDIYKRHRKTTAKPTEWHKDKSKYNRKRNRKIEEE